MLDLTYECLFKSVIKKRIEIKSMETGMMQSSFFMLHKKMVNNYYYRQTI